MAATALARRRNSPLAATLIFCRAPCRRFLAARSRSMRQPTWVGGRDFGQLGNPSAGAHIVSRNLTPDHTGRAVGGDSFSEFLNAIRTGTDPDPIHPFTCPGNGPATCVPFPFDPSKLLVMRWPFFQDMTDRDLLAIYEYLSAVPCIAGPALSPSDPLYPALHHDCGK